MTLLAETRVEAWKPSEDRAGSLGYRVADAHVQGHPAQRRSRLTIFRFPTPGSRAGTSPCGDVPSAVWKGDGTMLEQRADMCSPFLDNLLAQDLDARSRARVLWSFLARFLPKAFGLSGAM